MDPKQIAKQMIAFNKTAFDSNFNAMKAIHEQTEMLVNQFWEKSPLFPEDSRKSVAEWMVAYKKGRDDFKSIVDENFKKVEDFL